MKLSNSNPELENEIPLLKHDLPMNRRNENNEDLPLGLPADMAPSVGQPPISADRIPPELPEDLKQQLLDPNSDLPEELKAQLMAPRGEIPEDIRKSLETPPREVSIDEVNDPDIGPVF
jgi:hypothetical protein